MLCVVVSSSFAAEVPTVIFSNDFKGYYPEIVDSSLDAMSGLPLEEPVTVISPNRIWTAIVNRTDGVKVPYDQSLGRIQVIGEGQPTTMIAVHGFRTVTVNWINDRLLHINLGLGRIAWTEAIYDLQAHRWIYQDSITSPP
jgi:hypothetical protein